MKPLNLPFVILAIALVGCAGKEIKTAPLNAWIDENPYESELKIESPAKIGLMQPLAKDGPGCEKAAKELEFGIHPTKKDKQIIRIEKLCIEKPHMIVFQTQDFLQPGSYSFKVETPAKTKLIVNYQDPDFGSGPAQIPSGSTPLDKNGKVSSALNASLGIKTAWIHILGDKGRTTLGVVADGGQDLTISIYKMTENLANQHLIKSIKSKENIKLDLSSDPLFLKLESSVFSGELKYTVFRKDGAGSGAESRVAYNLVDRYILSESSSTLIIEANESLKVGDELLVFGQKAGSSIGELGRCKIMEIKGAEASCQLDGVNLQGVSQFRIEGKGE